MIIVNIATAFSKTPGPRSPDEGDYSGEEFLEKILEPAFVRAMSSGEKIRVILDGTEGYATSFLEASFGGLARKYGADRVLSCLDFISISEPYLVEEINEYVNDTRTQ